MRGEGLVALVLVAGGCSAEPGSEMTGESEQGGTTAGEPGTTTQGMTSVSDPATGSSSAGITAGAGDSDTGSAGSDSGDSSDGGDSSSDTGGEPPGSPGCTSPGDLAEGEHQFMLDGLDRRYILRLPASYSTDKPWPLIFALHGNGGNPGYWDGIGGDRDIRTAFADDAVIIIPEAINNAWRDYDAPSETWPAGIELELNYFDTILETARNELCIDDDNVFSMGFSGGGSFSGVLGCRRDYIRAIAAGGSVIYFDQDDCTSTPAAWITIGEDELTAGREAFRDFFRTLAGCEGTSMAGEPGGCVDYDSCEAGTPVTYCSHPAGHVWPSIGTDATKAFFEQFYGPTL